MRVPKYFGDKVFFNIRFFTDKSKGEITFFDCKHNVVEKSVRGMND